MLEASVAQRTSNVFLRFISNSAREEVSIVSCMFGFYSRLAWDVSRRLSEALLRALYADSSPYSQDSKRVDDGGTRNYSNYRGICNVFTIVWNIGRCLNVVTIE